MEKAKKKTLTKVKKIMCLIWYTPWVWLSDICHYLADESRAEKTIRSLILTQIALFFTCILTVIALIYIWKLVF